MPKIVIIEDNIEFSSEIKIHLEANICKKDVFDTVSVYNSDFLELLEVIKQNGRTKNLYIIDIDLNDAISGLEFAVGIRRIDPDCYLLFLTSHIELMSQVFVHNLKAISFIYKGDPLKLERIDAALDQIHHELGLDAAKVEALNSAEFTDELNKSVDPDKIYMANRTDKVNAIQYQYKNSHYKIAIDKITFIETDTIKRRLDIYTDKEIYHCPWKLKELVDILPDEFIQIYRSIIVNSKAIKRISNSMGNYTVVLNNDMSLPVSKNYLEEVINVFHEISF